MTIEPRKFAFWTKTTLSYTVGRVELREKHWKFRKFFCSDVSVYDSGSNYGKCMAWFYSKRNLSFKNEPLDSNCSQWLPDTFFCRVCENWSHWTKENRVLDQNNFILHSWTCTTSWKIFENSWHSYVIRHTNLQQMCGKVLFKAIFLCSEWSTRLQMFTATCLF